MKKRLMLLLLGLMILSLCACGGDVSRVEILDWTPSERYSDRDIEQAIAVVKETFHAGFEGCVLTSIAYPGDEAIPEFEQWARDYGADEAIVLISSFEVGPSGGDGSLNPDSVYRNWKWVLVRDQGGAWEHKTHGYG